jgi:hypothetical protein
VWFVSFGRYRILKDFSMAGAIAEDRDSFPFVLDEKHTVVPGGSAGEANSKR